MPKNETIFYSPVEYGLYVFGGKWENRVLGMLHIHDKLRYSEIIELLPGITNPILSSVLKKFQKEEIIIRKHYEEIPPRVEYSLTPKGWELVRILQEVCFWAEKYHGRDREHEFKYCSTCTLYEEKWKESAVKEE